MIMQSEEALFSFLSATQKQRYKLVLWKEKEGHIPGGYRKEEAGECWLSKFVGIAPL
jgi:hypothetical protein